VHQPRTEPYGRPTATLSDAFSGLVPHVGAPDREK